MTDDFDPDALFDVLEFADDDPDGLPVYALLAGQFAAYLRDPGAGSITLETPWGPINVGPDHDPPSFTEAIRSDAAFRDVMTRRFEMWATVARRLLLERAAREEPPR